MISSPRSSTPVLLLLLLLAGLAGCTPPEAADPDDPAAQGFVVPSAPTAWSGEVPCADCPGLRETLVLTPDGRYRTEVVDLGDPGAGPDDEARGGATVGWRGRWVLELDESASGSTGEVEIWLEGGPDGREYLRALENGDLRPLDVYGHEVASALTHTLVRLDHVPELGGRAREVGLFTYMADAALFVPCQSGIQTPVAMEAGYLGLERAYLDRDNVERDRPASPDRPEWMPAPMLVLLEGSIESRPAMEGSGSEEVFVVQEWSAAPDDAICPARNAREAFAGTRWRLVRLEGTPLEEVPAAGERPTLAWDPEGSQLSGSGGCNRFTGRGVLRGTDLVGQRDLGEPGGLAATRRHCDGAMELEARYLELLSEGGRLELSQGELRLFQGPREVARFEAGG